MTSTNRNRICFVAHLAYGAMTGGNGGFIGGVERQTSLMARWLAARGYRVSLITWDEGQEDGVVIDGVQVFKVCRKEAGIKGLRFFWPRWSSLPKWQFVITSSCWVWLSPIGQSDDV